MATNRETEAPVCQSCGLSLALGSEFWIVARYVKKPFIIKCPTCEKGTVTFEYSLAEEKYMIIKDCMCPTIFGEARLESLKNHKAWEKKYYYFCDKCFQKENPLKNIVSTEVLGEAKPNEPA